MVAQEAAEAGGPLPWGVLIMVAVGAQEAAEAGWPLPWGVLIMVAVGVVAVVLVAVEHWTCQKASSSGRQDLHGSKGMARQAMLPLPQ